MALIIDNVRKVSLSDTEEQILIELFAGYRRLVINGELSGGFGGAKVLQVTPLQSGLTGSAKPLVVKVGPKATIEREWDAFTSILSDSLPKMTEVWGEPVYIGEMGGLCYPLLGSGTFTVTDLLTYFRTKSRDDIQFTLGRLMEVLERMARYHETRGSYDMRLCFDLILPLNLLVAQEQPPSGVKPHLIRPDQVSNETIKTGDYVRVEGFAVLKSDPKHRNVTLVIPKRAEEEEANQAATAYCLRLEPVEAGVKIPGANEIMPPVEGVVVQTRAGHFQREVEAAFGPALDLTGEKITLPGGDTLFNPVTQLKAYLDKDRHDIKWAKIHGDMNLGNILVDVDTGDVNIIDYSEARTDYALHDFLRLESEVMLKFVPELIDGPDFEVLATIRAFYQQLHWATLYPGSARLTLQPPNPALRKPFEILKIIRRRAQRYLFNFENYNEYYNGLIAYLLGVLKFKERPRFSKQVAFVAAATLAGIVNDELGSWLPPSPYRGLRAFEVEHAPNFFGRNLLIEQILERLRTMLGASAPQAPRRRLPFGSQTAVAPPPLRLLALVGASGSGKSSLAQAGIIGSLHRGRLENSEAWPVIRCRPGANPLESLALTILNEFASHPNSTAIDRLVNGFPENERTLHLIVEAILTGAPASRRAVIFIDQFEEVFALEEDETRRTAFLDNLFYAAQVEGGRTIILFTLRGDFYDRFAGHQLLAGALPGHHLIVSPMQPAQLRQAIAHPAAQAGCSFKEGLVDEIMRAVQGQSGSLPLMQYALQELWLTQLQSQDDDKIRPAKYQPQHKRLITWDAYEAIGGVAGALQRRADAVYDSLSPDEQTLCREIFLRLVKTGEGDEVAKRRLPLADLLTLAADPAPVRSVIDTLAAGEEDSDPESEATPAQTGARLLTISNVDDRAGGETQVELAHEALIAHWPLLQGWIETNREALRIRDDLARAAMVWQQNDRDDGYLWRGARLLTAEEWAESATGDLPALSREFLTASLEQRDAAEREKEAQRQRELELAQQATEAARLRAEAEEQKAAEQQKRAEAEAKRAEEEGRRAEAQAKATKRALLALVLAILLLILAIGASVIIWSKVQQETSRKLAAAAMANLDIDPERSILLARFAITTSRTSEAEQALQRAVQTSRLQLNLPGHNDTIWDVAFSPEGERLATASYDGTARIWDVNSGQVIFTFTGHTDEVWGVAFSPDGVYLATASADETVKLWKAVTGEVVLTLSGHTKRVWGVAFSPDGRYLATTSFDQTANVWDISTALDTGIAPEQPVTVLNHGDSVTGAAFSPTGTYLATASWDGTVKIWEIPSGVLLRTLAHGSRVNSVAFHPEGQRLASAGQDGRVRNWRVETGDELPLPLIVETSQVWDVAFSPDGERLVWVNADGTAKVANAATGQLLLSLTGHTDAVRAVAFSPDGTHLVSAGWDKQIKVWDVASHSNVVNHVVFSADGARLATASRDRTAKVWDAATGVLLQTLTGHKASIRRIAFNTVGSRLATASEDNTARVWDIASGQTVLTLTGHTDWVYGVAFSPDDSRLATASYDETARIWDAFTGQPVLTLTGHTNWVNDIAFSPDGRRVATASFDKTVRLWDTTTGEEVLRLEHPDTVGSVAFSPDGKYIATAGVVDTGLTSTGLAKVWDATTGAEIRDLSGHTNWVREIVFSADGSRLATASWDNTARIWESSSGEELHIFEHSSDVNSVAFSPDGLRLATASAESAPRLYRLDFTELWNVSTQRLTRSIFTPAECQQYFWQNQGIKWSFFNLQPAMPKECR